MRKPKFERRMPKSCAGSVADFGTGTFSAFRPSALRVFVLAFVLTLGISGGAAPATNDIPALLPPRPELPPGFWEQHGRWVILGSAVLAILAAAGVWWLTRPRPVPPPSPAVEATQALGALRQQPEDGQALSRVSQIVRRYFAISFALPSGELTTGEFCRMIRGDESLGTGLSREVTEFLEECDRRKFAAGAPSAPLGAVARGLALIEQAEAFRDKRSSAPATTTRNDR